MNYPPDPIFVIEDDDGTIRRVDADTWMEWRLTRTEAAMRVGFTPITDDIEVSTVLLPCSTNYLGGDDAPPRCFETMVFGGDNHGAQVRYDTRKQARKGHWDMVRAIRGELGLMSEENPE